MSLSYIGDCILLAEIIYIVYLAKPDLLLHNSVVVLCVLTEGRNGSLNSPRLILHSEMLYRTFLYFLGFFMN